MRDVAIGKKGRIMAYEGLLFLWKDEANVAARLFQEIIPERNEMFHRYWAEYYDSGKSAKNGFFGNTAKYPHTFLCYSH